MMKTFLLVALMITPVGIIVAQDVEDPNLGSSDNVLTLEEIDALRSDVDSNTSRIEALENKCGTESLGTSGVVKAKATLSKTIAETESYLKKAEASRNKAYQQLSAMGYETSSVPQSVPTQQITLATGPPLQLSAMPGSTVRSGGSNGGSVSMRPTVSYSAPMVSYSPPVVSAPAPAPVIVSSQPVQTVSAPPTTQQVVSYTVSAPRVSSGGSNGGSLSSSSQRQAVSTATRPPTLRARLTANRAERATATAQRANNVSTALSAPVRCVDAFGNVVPCNR